MTDEDFKERLLDGVALGLAEAQVRIFDVANSLDVQTDSEAVCVGSAMGAGACVMAYTMADRYGIPRNELTKAKLMERARRIQAENTVASA